MFVFFAITLLLASHFRTDRYRASGRLPVRLLLLPVRRDVRGQGGGRGRGRRGRGRRGRGSVGGGGGGDPGAVGAVGRRRLGGAAGVELGTAEAGAAALDAASCAGRRSGAGRGAGPANSQSLKVRCVIADWIGSRRHPSEEFFPKHHQNCPQSTIICI